MGSLVLGNSVIRCADSVIVLSTIGLEVKICSVVGWFGLNDFCLVSIIDSIDDACCENFKERGEENNRPQVPPSKLRPIILFSPLCKILSAWIINKINDTLEAFRFISLWKRFQNSVCFCWCIYCFCHAVAYFRNLFVYGFGSVFYNFNRDLITSRTFAWLFFSYYFARLICSGGHCH